MVLCEHKMLHASSIFHNAFLRGFQRQQWCMPFNYKSCNFHSHISILVSQCLVGTLILCKPELRWEAVKLRKPWNLPSPSQYAAPCKNLFCSNAQAGQLLVGSFCWLLHPSASNKKGTRRKLVRSPQRSLEQQLHQLHRQHSEHPWCPRSC